MKNRVLAASPCPTGQERTDKPEPCVTDETLFCIDGVVGSCFILPGRNTVFHNIPSDFFPFKSIGRDAFSGFPSPTEGFTMSFGLNLPLGRNSPYALITVWVIAGFYRFSTV
ncbi:MAG: hypothetical protein K9J17_13825 [Flavobacteriales bacterium]|nr:hypothetical protein [Flavobacteriales bacterium]